MSQAILRAEADYESFEYWDFGNNNNTIEFAKRYFVPYLNIIKTYEPGTFPADLDISPSFIAIELYAYKFSGNSKPRACKNIGQ